MLFCPIVAENGFGEIPCFAVLGFLHKYLQVSMRSLLPRYRVDRLSECAFFCKIGLKVSISESSSNKITVKVDVLFNSGQICFS